MSYLPAAVLDARRRLLELLGDRGAWSEKQLRESAGLNASLYKEAMTVLLGDGLVQQRYNAAGRTELILPDPALSPGAVLEGPISVKAAEVLGRLLLNAEGISSLAKALNFSPAVTLESVEELERLGRVARRQVGMLVIYRVATLSTVG